MSSLQFYVNVFLALWTICWTAIAIVIVERAWAERYWHNSMTKQEKQDWKWFDDE